MPVEGLHNGLSRTVKEFISRLYDARPLRNGCQGFFTMVSSRDQIRLSAGFPYSPLTGQHIEGINLEKLRYAVAENGLEQEALAASSASRPLLRCGALTID